ncbi:conserved hypothetical protein [Histoplasma capsulatum H143]|uniref:Uncharacterized protein n=1 Tax=Ajellomyces capsulatus (strain H143) TaxID=544712 RepID=C6HST1_AJECH|nr:conserved hypothetical protein [Histoplasma capsulatum H143]
MRIPIHTALALCCALTTIPRSDPTPPCASTLQSPSTSRGDFSRPLDAFRSKVFQGYAAYGSHLHFVEILFPGYPPLRPLELAKANSIVS